MPKVSKDSAANVERHGPVDDRNEDLDGYTVNFGTFDADVDGTPLLKGMPETTAHARTGGTCSGAASPIASRTTTRSSRPATRSTCRPATSRSSTPAANSCSSAPPRSYAKSPS